MWAERLGKRAVLDADGGDVPFPPGPAEIVPGDAAASRARGFDGVLKRKGDFDALLRPVNALSCMTGSKSLVPGA